MFSKIKNRWIREGGYREVLIISIPLILSTGAWSVLLFVDRMYLAWYSQEAIAAAMPAGMTSFAMMCVFIGTAAYVNTFVAQYFGAKEEHKIGPIVWQGIYLSGLSLILVVPAYFLAESFFSAVGHASKVQRLEVDYFRLLMYSASFIVFNNTLSGFFSGLGKTMIVMWVSILITIVNLFLDYILIFGRLGFPELGIRGAALATNIAVISGSAVFLYLFLRNQYRQRFRTWVGCKFDSRLFHRLVYFGFPNGLRLFIDMSSFTAFLMFIGTLGTAELVASTIAFNINALAFLPMVGLMIAVSVLVGQRLGENNPALAETATWSALHIAITFFGILAALYLLVPYGFIWPFTLNNGLDDISLIIVLLRFVAFFGLFDAMFLVFLGALEGAGDTRFIMKTSVLISWFLLVVPCYLCVKVFEADLIVLWWVITLNVVLYCAIFYRRFLKGPWKMMRVISDH